MGCVATLAKTFRHRLGASFGPVYKGGYGVCYRFAGSHTICIHITSYKSVSATVSHSVVPSPITIIQSFRTLTSFVHFSVSRCRKWRGCLTLKTRVNERAFYLSEIFRRDQCMVAIKLIIKLLSSLTKMCLNAARGGWCPVAGAIQVGERVLQY